MQKLTLGIGKSKHLENEQHNLYEELKGMEEVLHQGEKELSTQISVVENVHENHNKDPKLLVAKEKKLWKELQVAQGKVELLTLQTTNNWEIMAIKNETKVALYDELIKQ